MPFFDASYLKIDDDIARALGFRRVFCAGSDFYMGKGQGKLIVDADAIGQGALKALMAGNAVGIAFGFAARIEEKVLAYAAAEEKLVVIDAGSIMRSAQARQSQTLAKAHWLFMHAKRAGARIAIATLSKNGYELRSAKQLMYLANAIGATEAEAKLMLAEIGEALK
ncbi:MAG: hypothetical protein ACP5T3_02935 [Candidatus Micrarchaeia archaeon]